jgi:hypothetical protein
MKDRFAFGGKTYGARPTKKCAGVDNLAKDFAELVMGDLSDKGLFIWPLDTREYAVKKITGFADEFISGAKHVLFGTLYYDDKFFHLNAPENNEGKEFERLVETIAYKIADWLAIYGFRQKEDILTAMLFYSRRLIESIFGLPEINDYDDYYDDSCLDYDGEAYRLNYGGIQKLASNLSCDLAAIAQETYEGDNFSNPLNEKSRIIQYKTQEALYNFFKKNFMSEGVNRL